MSNDTDLSTALQALGWEPLNIMRRKAKAKLMYKVLNKMAPEPLTKLFKYKNEITNHHLRNYISTSFCAPQPRTNNTTRNSNLRLTDPMLQIVSY